MKSRHEMIVKGDDLANAAKWINRGKRSERDETVLLQAEDGFTIKTPVARTRVLAAGVWASSVAVNAGVFARLTRKFPKAAEITLIYTTGQLHVNRTAIPAREI